MEIGGVSNWSAAEAYGFIQALQGVFEIIPDTPFAGDADYESEAKIVASQLALAWDKDCENINSYAYLRTIAALLVETTTVSYADLGVPLVDGGLPPVILAEHITIVAVYKKIIESKAEHQ